MFSLYLSSSAAAPRHRQSQNIPVVLDRLDDEAERRADAVDVLAHDLLHNSRLSCIVQAPCLVSSQSLRARSGAPTTSGSASPCPSDVLFVKSTALLLFVAVLPSGSWCCWSCRLNFAASWIRQPPPLPPCPPCSSSICAPRPFFS